MRHAKQIRTSLPFIPSPDVSCCSSFAFCSCVELFNFGLLLHVSHFNSRAALRASGTACTSRRNLSKAALVAKWDTATLAGRGSKHASPTRLTEPPGSNVRTTGCKATEHVFFASEMLYETRDTISKRMRSRISC